MDFTHINIELESGTVKIKLRTDLAPNHCERVAAVSYTHLTLPTKA